jgi:PadR family transcriptional regulator
MASGAGPRMTLPTQLVLRAMLAEPTQEMYGLQIGQAAELPSGTIHPILARLEGCGWLKSRWEEIDPAKEGRPRRRYYRLSPDGVEHARNALARVHTPRALVNRLRPGLAGEYGGGTP